MVERSNRSGNTSTPRSRLARPVVDAETSNHTGGNRAVTGSVIHQNVGSVRQNNSPRGHQPTSPGSHQEPSNFQPARGSHDIPTAHFDAGTGAVPRNFLGLTPEEEIVRQQTMIRRLERDMQKLNMRRYEERQEMLRLREQLNQRNQTQFHSVEEESGSSRMLPPGFANLQNLQDPFPSTSTMRNAVSTPAAGLGANLHLEESAIDPPPGASAMGPPPPPATETPRASDRRSMGEVASANASRDLTTKVLERSRAGNTNPFQSTDSEGDDLHFKGNPANVATSEDVTHIMAKLDKEEPHEVNEGLELLNTWQANFQPVVGNSTSLDVLPLLLTKITHLLGRDFGQELKVKFSMMGKTLYTKWRALEQSANMTLTREARKRLEDLRNQFRAAGFSETIQNQDLPNSSENE